MVSNPRITEVFAIPQSMISAKERLLLLFLADRENPDTGRCDPSIARACAETSLPRSIVFDLIRKLEEKQILEVHRKPGRRSSYSIRPVRESDPSGIRTRPGVGREGSGNRTGPVRESDPNPKRTQREPKEEKNSLRGRASARKPDPNSPLTFTIKGGAKLWAPSEALLAELSLAHPEIDVQRAVADLAQWTRDKEPDMQPSGMERWIRGKISKKSETAKRKPAASPHKAQDILENPTTEELLAGFDDPQEEDRTDYLAGLVDRTTTAGGDRQ